MKWVDSSQEYSFSGADTCQNCCDAFHSVRSVPLVRLSNVSVCLGHLGQANMHTTRFMRILWQLAICLTVFLSELQAMNQQIRM